MIAPKSSAMFDNFLQSVHHTTIEALRKEQEKTLKNYEVAGDSRLTVNAINSLWFVFLGTSLLCLLFKPYLLSVFVLILGIGAKYIYRPILIRRVAEAEKRGTTSLTEEGVSFVFYDLEEKLAKILGTNVNTLAELPVEDTKVVCSDHLKGRAREIISLEKDGAQLMVIAQARSIFRAEHKVMHDLGLAGGEWGPYFK